MASYFPRSEPWGEFSSPHSLFPSSTTDHPRGERVPGPSSPSTTVISSFTDSPPSTIWQFHDPDPMDLSAVPEVSVQTLPESTPFPYFGSFSEPERPAASPPAPIPSPASVPVPTRQDPGPAKPPSCPPPTQAASPRTLTPAPVPLKSSTTSSVRNKTGGSKEKKGAPPPSTSHRATPPAPAQKPVSTPAPTRTQQVVKEKAKSPKAPPLSPLEALQKQLAPLTTHGEGKTSIAGLSQLPGFLTLLQDESNQQPPLRLHLLSILQASSPEIHERFVSEQGLDLCQQWLHSGHTQVALATMQLLAALPVTLPTLKENGRIGKTVKRLSRSGESSEIRSLAEQVVTLWKAMIDSAEKKRPLTSKAEPPSKKPCLSSSNAFKSRQTPRRDANVLVVKKRAPKKASLPSRSTSPQPKAEVTPPPPAPTPAPLSPTPQARVKLVSCLSDPKNRKPKRTLSWATPLRHVKCFPKDKESKVSEDYRRLVRPRASAERENPPARPATPVAPPTPRVNVCPIVPTLAWYAPRPLDLPVSGPVVSVSSTEAREMKGRQKAQPCVFYPERRHIPDCPPLLNSSVGRRSEEPVPSIPLAGAPEDPPPVENHPPPAPTPASASHHLPLAPTSGYHSSSAGRDHHAHAHSQHSYSSYPPQAQPAPRPHDPHPSSFGYPPSTPSGDAYAQRSVPSDYGAPQPQYQESYPTGAPPPNSNQRYTQEQYLTLKILLQQGAIQSFMDGKARSEDAAQVRQLLESMQQSGIPNHAPPPSRNEYPYPPHDRNNDRNSRSWGNHPR